MSLYIETSILGRYLNDLIFRLMLRGHDTSECFEISVYSQDLIKLCSIYVHVSMYEIKCIYLTM